MFQGEAIDYRGKYNKVVLISVSPLQNGYWKLEGKSMRWIESKYFDSWQPLTLSHVCSAPPGLTQRLVTRYGTQCTLVLYNRFLLRRSASSSGMSRSLASTVALGPPPGCHNTSVENVSSSNTPK